MLGASKIQGSILVVSTLILSILAGLSIATMQNVVTDYQLSTQDQDKTLALQSAQYALAEAKRLVLTKWSPGSTPCATVVGCSAQNGIAVWSYNAFLNTTDFRQKPASYFNAAQATATSPNLNTQAPRFFVIDLGCDRYSKVNIYRIVAIGFGKLPNTVAFAESQLTMPLSGQNYMAPGAMQSVAALLNNNPVYTYQLTPSSSRAHTFFNTSGGGTCTNPGQTLSTGATCEMNCLGEVRVKGYSAYNNAPCPWVYGDWVSNTTSTNTSTLTLASNSSGSTATVACKAAGASACPSGQTFNGTCCASNCDPSGTTGQVWSCSSSTCVCPSGTSMQQNTSGMFAFSCCMNITNNCTNGQSRVCGGGCGCTGTLLNTLEWSASMNCCVGSVCNQVGGSYPQCGGCSPATLK
jgi:Tfp pilus assembly protein PilX